MIVLVVASAVGLLDYSRVIAAMYQPPTEVPASPPISLGASAVLAALTLLLILLGVYPTPLIQMIQAIVGKLT